MDITGTRNVLGARGNIRHYCHFACFIHFICAYLAHKMEGQKLIMESKLEKSVKSFFNPAAPLQAGTVTSPYRQARKFLCKQLGITMKQLRNRRVLAGYIYRNGVYLKAEVM